MLLNKFLKKVEEIQTKQRGTNAPVHRPVNHDESNWLISYADLMTLLCGFFIMMLSMTTVQAVKYEKVRKELSQEFGGQYHAPVEEMTKFMTQMVHELGIEKETTITSDATGVIISFESTIFFGTLSARIETKGEQILNTLIKGIKAKQDERQAKLKIVVEGHTDAQPVIAGIYPSNWELSSARAARVVRMFLESGFSPMQLIPIGFADTRPQTPNRLPSGEWNQEALSKNRRVILRVLEPQADFFPWDASPAVNAH